MKFKGPFEAVRKFTEAETDLKNLGNSVPADDPNRKELEATVRANRRVFNLWSAGLFITLAGGLTTWHHIERISGEEEARQPQIEEFKRGLINLGFPQEEAQRLTQGLNDYYSANIGQVSIAGAVGRTLDTLRNKYGDNYSELQLFFLTKVRMRLATKGDYYRVNLLRRSGDDVSRERARVSIQKDHQVNADALEFLSTAPHTQRDAWFIKNGMPFYKAEDETLYVPVVLEERQGAGQMFVGVTALVALHDARAALTEKDPAKREKEQFANPKVYDMYYAIDPSYYMQATREFIKELSSKPAPTTAEELLKRLYPSITNVTGTIVTSTTSGINKEEAMAVTIREQNKLAYLTVRFLLAREDRALDPLRPLLMKIVEDPTLIK